MISSILPGEIKPRNCKKGNDTQIITIIISQQKQQNGE
jgi:hypothetical protein